MSNCIIPDCEEEIHYIHLQVCKACYAGLSTWRGRSIRDKHFRLGRCKRLASRMDFILDNPKHAPKRVPLRGLRIKRRASAALGRKKR